MLSAPASMTAAALGDELTESEATLRVFLTAGGLAILGCALLLFTIWWWRGTKPEPPALGPLEVMSDRRWHAASDNERRRLVEEHRPASALSRTAPAPVPIDLSVLARDQPRGFDDLRDEPNRWPYGPAESSPSADGSVLAGGGAVLADEPVGVVDLDATVPAPASGVDLDETMFQMPAPSLAAVATNGDSLADEFEQLDLMSMDADDDHDDHDDHDDRDHLDSQHDEPSEEMVIDPLLQRTALQD